MQICWKARVFISFLEFNMLVNHVRVLFYVQYHYIWRCLTLWFICIAVKTVNDLFSL